MGRPYASKTLQLLLLVAALASLAAGCGDKSGPDSGPKTGAPQADQPLNDAIGQLNRVIRGQDCDAFVALAYSALRVNAAGTGPAAAGEAVRPEECEEIGADVLLKRLEGTTFDEFEDRGAAAFAQGPAEEPASGYDTWALVLLADRDGRWRNLSFYPADPQFGEEMAEAADPVGTTEQLVRAMRSGDCSDASRFMAGRTRLGEAPTEACRTLAAGPIFTPAVRAASDLAVEEIGSVRDYSVVGVDTGRAYFGVLLATPPIKPGRPPQGDVFVNDLVPMTDFEIVEHREDGGSSKKSE